MTFLPRRPLQPPPPFVAEAATRGMSQQRTDEAITVVSDYVCPFCY